MKLKSLEDVDIEGKTVLYRAPYDIEPVRVDGGYELKSLDRIIVTLPTIKYLLDKSCKVVILTYVGRPEGKVVEHLRTNLHAEALGKCLGIGVKKVDDCVGPVVLGAISHMARGEILMLENTRFYKEEMEDDDEFARELAKNGEIVVFDGFPQAHRKHASVTGIMRHLPSYAGPYLMKEIDVLSGILDNPKKPFVSIVGGAKISGKLPAISNLLKISDNVLTGGGVANVLLSAKGVRIGDSLVEDINNVGAGVSGEFDGVVEEARYGKKIITPIDLKIGEKNEEENEVGTIDIEEGVPDGWAAYDLGPKTVQMYTNYISGAGTVFWSGPLGVFENPVFADGTKNIIDAMVGSKANTVIAGGDTVSSVRRLGDIDKFGYVSYAGGATLEFISGKTLPALEMLKAD